MLLYILGYLAVLLVLSAVALGCTLVGSRHMIFPEGVALGAAVGTLIIMGGSIAYFKLFPFL